MGTELADELRRNTPAAIFAEMTRA